MSLSGVLKAGLLKSLGAVRHTNLVGQQDNGEFEFLTDLNNTAALSITDLMWKIKITLGLVSGVMNGTKFGSASIGATISPVCESLFYRTPTSAASLEFVSDDVNDSASGSGAREMEFTGLDANFNEVTQIISTNGTTAVPLPIDLIRHYRFQVTSSGTYASQIAGSHQGNLTLRESGAGQVWSVIPNTPFPAAQSQIGVVSIPIGKTIFITKRSFNVDSVKAANIFIFERQNIDDVTVPYTGVMRLIEKNIGVTGYQSKSFVFPIGPFVGPADVGIMGVFPVGSGDISVDFEMFEMDT